MIIVMGLPGAGKSTVLEAVEKKGWEIINYGTLMLEIAKKEYKIEDRDSIRKLDQEKQKKLQALVGKYLAAKKEKNIILDTHCSVNTPKGYLPGLPFEILKNLKVERLILITAPIDQIIRRRTTDNTRIRDLQDEQSLLEHDQMNRYYLATYSVITGAPAAIIINYDGQLQQAQKRLLELLE
jgi:adenylate kinase